MNLQRQMFQLRRICVCLVESSDFFFFFFSPRQLGVSISTLLAAKQPRVPMTRWWMTLKARTSTCLNFLGKWNFPNVYGISDSSTTNYPTVNNTYNLYGRPLAAAERGHQIIYAICRLKLSRSLIHAKLVHVETRKRDRAYRIERSVLSRKFSNNSLLFSSSMQNLSILLLSRSLISTTKV